MLHPSPVDHTSDATAAAAVAGETPPPDDVTSDTVAPAGGRPDTPPSVTVASDAEIESGIRSVMAAVPLATRHAVARAALRAGVRALVTEPMRIVELLREPRAVVR